MENDLQLLKSCVITIAKSSIFPARAVGLGLYDFTQLKGPFDSIRSLEYFGTNVKRQALDYLGFLTWWTLSTSIWDLYIPQEMVDTILDFGLVSCPKHNVLINLERDWQQISIPHLLCHHIPVFYRWNETLQNTQCFLSLSPTTLQAFEEHRRATSDGKVFTADLLEFTSAFKAMKDYDEFFQCQVFHNKPLPDLEFRRDWDYAVVDFQGWMYCPISLETAREFTKLFGSHVV